MPYKDKEKKKENDRKRRERDPEHFREIQRRYYERHREEIRSKARHHMAKWRKKHPKEIIEYQRARLKNTKAKLVAMFGGKCSKCGYDRCYAALEFHHSDPSKKETGISRLLTGRIEKAVEEAKKCVLVCRNCHAEIHESLKESASLQTRPASV